MPGLRATVAFPHSMHLGGAWYLNLADGPARPPAGQPWQVLHRWVRLVGDDDAARPQSRSTAWTGSWSEGAAPSNRATFTPVEITWTSGVTSSQSMRGPPGTGSR